MTDSLRDILDLERIEDRMFRGRTRPTDVPRVFGGEVAAQALVAAGRTVPNDRRVHSLHSYFLRPGDPRAAILYLVDETRDGRSFTTRRVLAVQHGEVIFTLAASFQVAEQGVGHQIPQLSARGLDDLPAIDTLPVEADEPARSRFARLRERFPVDVRSDPGLPPVDGDGERRAPEGGVWIRAAQRLGDDPLVHVCAVTYISDLFLLPTALLPHGVTGDDPGVQLASLDHAVWFHAPLRADDWLYYQHESPWSGGGRALCRGQLFDQAGRLVASVVQEGLARLPASAR